MFNFLSNLGICLLEAKWTKCVTFRGTTLKNNEVNFIIRVNFHAQVDNLLNARVVIEKLGIW